MQRYSPTSRRRAMFLAAAALSVLWSAVAPAADPPGKATTIPTAPAASGRAAPAAAGDDQFMTVRQLDLSPAPLPAPALKYRLMPPVSEQTPGNAVLSYFRAFVWLEQISGGNKEARSRLENEYLTLPPSQLPLAQARRDIDRFRSVLELVDAGARRATCSWNPPLPIETHLTPEVQAGRAVTRLLTARARLEIAEGRLDRALRTLQTTYALGQHFTEQRILVSALVGIAIRGIASHTAEEFISAPGAPNLYWALASLPSPLAEVRQTLEAAESQYPEDFPALHGVENAAHTPEQWQALWRQALREVDAVETAWRRENSKPVQPRDPKSTLEKTYPAAAARLIQRGRAKTQVEAMPRERAVLIDAIETYRETYSDGIRWLYAAYPAGAEQPPFEVRRVPEGAPLLFGGSVTPMLWASRRAAVSSDRTVAALCVIEALRHYAHGRGGRLPERLDQITDVPIPLDPITGKPFVYQLHGGDLGVLDAVGPPPTQPRRWKIGIRKPAASSSGPSTPAAK